MNQSSLRGAHPSWQHRVLRWFSHRRAIWTLAAASLCLPAVHPLLLPLLGVPSHLLWFVQVLAVAIAGYRAGIRGGLAMLVTSAATVFLGERAFGAGYGHAADWPTTVSLTLAVTATNALVLLFAITVRAAEARRRQVASIARAAIDAAPDPLMVIDSVRTIRLANRAVASLLSLPVQRCVGRSIDDFVGAAAPQLLQQGGVRALVLRRDDGTRIPIDLQVAPVVADVRRSAHWLIALRDTSHALRVAEAERRTSALVDRGHLVSAVAHELNNPLTGVVTYSELLAQEADLLPAQRELVATIHDEAARAAEIARRMLATVRGEPVERQLFDLAASLDRVQRAQGPRLAAHGVALRVAVAPGLPAIFGSAGQVEQILVGLLTNAMHALEGVRQATVEVRASPDAPPGGESLVRLVVEDSGSGVPADQVDQIFEPFYTTKAATGGTGLGLAVARRLAREHGGDLRYRRGDRLGGACFVMTLPGARVASMAAAASAGAPVAAREHELPRQLLLIEDEAAIANGFSRLLSRDGIKVTTAGTIAQARAQLDTTRFDAILSDVHLPDGTGPAFWREAVTRDPALRGRWVFMTGLLPDGDLQQEWDRHGESWLAKPATLDELRRALARKGREPSVV